jgi:N-acyl-D-amino-acid deacylase
MTKRLLLVFGFLLIVASLLLSCNRSDVDFDILITKGRIVNGTGNPWIYGDIGIVGDTIVAIGDLSEKTAAKTIDARGLVVSPGFIDLHTHCDNMFGNPDRNANLNFLIQGTTTVATGNCGSGTFKIAEAKAECEKQGIGTNVVMYVGSGTVRRAVIKEALPRPVTAEELEEMKSIIRQAMREGAWGMSAGVEYYDRLASTEELIELVKVVGEFGGIYDPHIREESLSLVEAIEESIRIGEETGVRVNTAHFKATGKKAWGLLKEATRVINDARARGVYITVDMYPYNKTTTGTLISKAIRVPKDMQPLAGLSEKMRDRNLGDAEREELREQYLDELVKALSDKLKREQIKKTSLVGYPNNPSAVALWRWDNFTIMAAKKNTDLIGKIVSDIAEEQKREPFEIVADLIIEERDDIYASSGAMSVDDMKYAMKQDWLMFSSDGAAAPITKKGDKPRPGHPRAFGSQARVLRKWWREENVLTLENAIRKMSSLPAHTLQIKDRGLLFRGYKADVVIFDPDTIRDNATYADTRQYSTGVEYVIINGEISVENGEYNGALKGRVLLLTENK